MLLQLLLLLLRWPSDAGLETSRRGEGLTNADIRQIDDRLTERRQPASLLAALRLVDVIAPSAAAAGGVYLRQTWRHFAFASSALPAWRPTCLATAIPPAPFYVTAVYYLRNLQLFSYKAPVVLCDIFAPTLNYSCLVNPKYY